MDRRHHSIQLAGPAAEGPRSAAADAAAQPQPSEGRLGIMSSELYLAVCEGRKEEVVELLAADQLAGIDQVSAAGNTVLHLAAEHGHDELIQEFYARSGGNVLLSSRNSARDTPLHCAARAGHDRAVSLLVQLQRAWDYGDDRSVTGCKNEAGDTALHLAARLGHGAAVEALVSAAPEVAAEVNDAGVSPLYLAVMSRSVPAVRSITTKCSDASAAGPTSQNALHAAVFQGSEMVSLLLDWKPSLAGKVDDDDSTPLHSASSYGDCSIVSAILQAASPYTARMRDSDGLSALHVAAGKGHVDIIGKLMEACPDAAELRDDRGGTFLHAAARGGHSKVVLFVINKTTLRGLLDAQDRDGNTPLHLAVDARACDVVKALMTTGEARADVMNREGHTPLDLAAKSTSLLSMFGLVVTLTTFGARSRPRRQDRVEQWNGSEINKGIDKTSDGLAVVAVLVATVAFSAANNVPGSYDKGIATLEGKTIFKAFLVLDSFAMITSVAAVILLIFSKASRSGSWKSYLAALHCISLSLISMILAFWAALAAVTSTRAVTIAYFVIYFVLYSVLLPLIKLPVSMDTMRKFRKGRYDVTRRRITQQYPTVDALVTSLGLFKITYYLSFAGFVVLSSLGRLQIDNDNIVYYLAMTILVLYYFLGRWFRRLWRTWLF